LPQTRTQIAELLAAKGIHPKRKFGQHYLVDLNIMRVLVDTAAPRPDDTVLEVGCGTGSLTELLSDRARHVVSVDVDPLMVEIAGEHLAGRSNVTFLLEDILLTKSRLNPTVVDTLTRVAAGGRILMIANLPYGAASPLIADCLHERLPLAGMWVMVQKEVADRLASPPGIKDYGPLTVAVQSRASVRIFRKVPASAFWPPPDVESAMIEILPDAARSERIRDVKRFDRLVTGVFTQRRKTLRAAVRTVRGPEWEGADWPAVFKSAGVDDSLRPDQLSIEQYVALANAGTVGPLTRDDGQNHPVRDRSASASGSA